MKNSRHTRASRRLPAEESPVSNLIGSIRSDCNADGFRIGVRVGCLALGFASKKKLKRKKCSAVRVECLLLGFASKNKALSKIFKGREKADGFRIGVTVGYLVLGFASKKNASKGRGKKLRRQR